MKNPYQEKILKAMQSFGYRYSVWNVFSDFVELGALAIANSADKKKQPLGINGKSNTLKRLANINRTNKSYSLKCSRI